MLSVEPCYKSPSGGAEFARNWICMERGWKLQGK